MAIRLPVMINVKLPPLFQLNDCVRVNATRHELIFYGLPTDLANREGVVMNGYLHPAHSTPWYTVRFGAGLTVEWDVPGSLLVPANSPVHGVSPPPVPPHVTKCDFPGHPAFRLVARTVSPVTLAVGELPTHMVLVENRIGERRWCRESQATANVAEAHFDASPTWAPAQSNVKER